jgi:hypothetical protein
MDSDRQREIVRADRARRQEREATELIALAEAYYPTETVEKIPRHAMAIRADAKAMGAVTAHTTRVHAPWSSLRTRCVGVSPDALDPKHELYGVNNSVKVIHPDGTSETTVLAKDRAPRRNASVEATATESRMENDYYRRGASLGFNSELQND